MAGLGQLHQAFYVLLSMVLYTLVLLLSSITGLPYLTTQKVTILIPINTVRSLL